LEAALFAEAGKKIGHRRHAEPDGAVIHQEPKRKHVTLTIVWDEYIHQLLDRYSAGRFRHFIVIRSGSSVGTLLAQTFAHQLDAVGVVDEAVEDGIAQTWIADDFRPAVTGHLAGDDQ
jgi:hypothetical protein